MEIFESMTEELFFKTFEFYYIPANVLGMIIFILTELVIMKESRANFSIKQWWEKNYLKSILSVLTSIACMCMFMSYGLMNIAIAIVIGFTSDALFKVLIKRFKKKTGIEDETTTQP